MTRTTGGSRTGADNFNFLCLASLLVHNVKLPRCLLCCLSSLLPLLASQLLSPAMSVVAPESLAFRHPRAVAGCSCPICTRWGTHESSDYPSPFALYRLVKWDPLLQSEREPTEEERAEFNRANPSMAFSRRAEEGGRMDTPWVKLCLRLVRRLKKEKNAPSFNQPVDYVALNLPDYPVRSDRDTAAAARHRGCCLPRSSAAAARCALFSLSFPREYHATSAST